MFRWKFNTKQSPQTAWTQNKIECLRSRATLLLNTLRPRQDGHHFADDIFKCIFLNENVWIPIKISLKFVPKGPINNIPAMVQIMAWRRPGNKPLSEPMVVSLPTHICIARPQWGQYMQNKWYCEKKNKFKIKYEGGTSFQKNSSINPITR